MIKIDNSIGFRIFNLRKEKLGISRESFGLKLGVSGSVIKNLETGLVDPMSKETFLEHMCLVYNIDKDWLLKGIGEPFLPMSRADEIAHWAGQLTSPNLDGSFKQKFVHMLTRLDESGWIALEQMARLMVEEDKNGD